MVCKQCWGLGVRHIQLLLLFACVMVGNILSSSHVIAIKLARETPTDSSTYYEDFFKIEVESKTIIEVLKLECSNYFVFFITRFLSGIICCKVNNKAYLLLIMLLYALQSYSVPSLAQKHGWNSLYGMRIVVGLLDGLLMPVVYQITAKWSPFTESSRCISFIVMGPFCARVFATGLVGFIGRSIGGWTSIFYISGNLGILWVVAWFTFGADDPKNCFYISLEEKFYIDKNTYDIESVLYAKAIPWKQIFRTKALYISMAIDSMTLWTYVFYMHCSFMTTYLKFVFGYTEEQVGVYIHYTSFLIILVAMAIVSVLSDYLNNKQIWPTLHQRKTCSSIGFWGSAICTVFIGYAAVEDTFIYTCYYILVVFQAFIYISFSLFPFDMAPNWAGLIFAISTSVGSIPVIFVPMVVEHLVTNFEVDRSWNWMFYLMALSFFSANFIYTMFFEGKVEEYNKITLAMLGSGGSRSTVQYDSLKLGSASPAQAMTPIPSRQKD